MEVIYKTITNMVYTDTRIPILIEDIDFRTVTYAGLSEEDYLDLKADMDQYIQERKDKHLLPFKKKTIKTTTGTSHISDSCPKEGVGILFIYLS